MTPLREFEQYTLLGEIAEGGMGIVYQAVHRGLNRSCALKLIRSGLLATPDERRRFVTEAEAAAKLDHPNIVRVGRAAEFNGQWFLEMELVEGGTLADRIAEGSVPSREAANLIACLARAVQHAHERGVLHRDLKPANILIAPDGQPKLTDFGLARFLEKDSDLTRTVAVLGTPAYLAPELASGHAREATTVADVYSLGVILFECLTGRRPFEAATPLEILRAVREMATPRPSSLHRDVPGDLETICLKCLEKNPARRYAAAGEVADDLERWLHHKPIQARPAGALERTWKWSRRKPAHAAAMAATLILIGVVLAYQYRVQRGELAIIQHRVEKLQALAELGFIGTDASFSSGETPKAIAFLARSLRENPSNQWAAERLMSALTYRSFALPVLAPLWHTGAVRSAVFSPDGTQILTASDDSTARLWEARTGAAVGVPLRHAAGVLSARFSPDGRQIITAGADRFARIWDARNGQPIGAPLAHSNEVRQAEFSADGARVVTAAGRLVRVWDARTGEPLCGWLPHRDGDPNVRSIQFSPDGRDVLTADGDSARRWPVSAEAIAKRDKLDSRIVQCARFSPDGRRIVIGSGDDTVRIWSVGETNTPLVLRGHTKDVDWVDFSPDGGRIVTVSKDRSARVWDAHTGDLLRGSLLHEGRATFARFSADGLRVLTVAEDRTVRIWDSETGEPLCEPLRHEASVASADFSPDGQFVVTASADGAARVWDVRFGGAAGAMEQTYHGDIDLYRKSTLADRNKPVVQLTNLQPDKADGIILSNAMTQPFLAHFSPQGRWFVTRESDGLLRLWKEQDAEPVPRAFSHDGPIRNLSVSHDRKFFAVVGADHLVHLWNTHSPTPLDFAEHIGLAFDPVFSPDGRRLLVVANGGVSLQLWDTANEQPAGAPFEPHTSGILFATFSPDGQSIATSSYDMTAAICDARTGERVARLAHDGYVRCVQFSPDGKWLVTASADATAQVWDVKTGRRLSDSMRHPSEVMWVSFSPDGRRVVTFAADRAARIWDAATGQRMSEPLRHATHKDDLPAWQGEFSADGTKIIAWQRPTLRRVWDLGTVPAPVPSWLPELAEAIGGLRLTERAASQFVSTEEFFRWRGLLAQTNGTDFYARWARWFFLDRSVRATSPFAETTRAGYIGPQARDQMRESVQEAVRLAPTNGLALLRLARAKLKQSFERNEPHGLRLRSEAELLSRRALELEPSEREAWLARIEVILNTGRKTEALALADEALKKFPNDPIVLRQRDKIAGILERAE